MNMYLYTDIDIFKNKTSAFFFVFEMKKERGIKRLWETFGELFRRTCEAAGTPKLGMGAKVRLKTALKTTSLFDYWQLCNGNGPSNQWTCVTERRVLRWKTNFKWLQLPPSPFCLSLSFSSPASASAFWRTVSRFSDGTNRDACFISPSSRRYPFHFLTLVSAWQVKLSSGMASPPLCWLHYL